MAAPAPAIVAPSPNQTALLAASGVPPPPAILAGAATIQDLVVAEDYTRDLKRRKADDAPSATTADICSAEVSDCIVYCCHVIIPKDLV